MKTLYKEMSVGKKPKELVLIVDEDNVNSVISGFEHEYKGYRAEPGSVLNEGYCSSENRDEKTEDAVLDEMEGDLDSLKSLSQGLIHMTPEEKVMDQIRAEIYGAKKVQWQDYFAKVKRKADGTFAIGRVIEIYQCMGFSYEDMDSYGRRGPELIIKTISDTEAELQIRTGMVEKW